MRTIDTPPHHRTAPLLHTHTHTHTHTRALSIEKQKRLDSLGWSYRRVREKTLKLDKIEKK